MKVMRSVIIEAPIAKVWAAIREFDGVANWNPGVSAARMESGTSTEIGGIRHLDIPDGSIFRETLLAHSDEEMFYTYDIVEGPLPCTDYVSTHKLIPITDGDQTLSIWTGEFNCAEKHEGMLENVVGNLIYQNGMRGLNAYMKEQG